MREMRRPTSLLLATALLLHLLLAPSMVQAYAIAQPNSVSELSPEVIGFLQVSHLQPSHFDADGNLVYFTATGQKGIMSKRAFDHPYITQQRYLLWENAQDEIRPEPKAAPSVTDENVLDSLSKLSPELAGFLHALHLQPSHFDVDGNLVYFTATGQKGIVSKNVFNHPYIVQQRYLRQSYPEAVDCCLENETEAVCPALMTFYIWAASHPDVVEQIIDMCMSVYDLVQIYGISSGQGVHLPAEAYKPLYPEPHFVIIHGEIYWN